MTVEDRADVRWHVGKEIPLALIFAFMVQTGGWIWFAATQTAQLGTLTDMMGNFRMEQYTQSDARRDMEVYSARSLNNTKRIDELVRRIEMLENK